MTESTDTPVTFEPLHVALAPDLSISGLWLRGEGKLTVLFLHDEGADVDAVLPLLVGLRLPEADKLAVDLPGHGLSDESGDSEQALQTLCNRLAAEGHGPFIVVGCGRSAALAWALGSRDDVLGIGLISPILDQERLSSAPPVRLVPALVFLATGSPEVVAAWTALRTRLRARWMSASLAVTHAELVSLDGCDGQVVSHLGGFARELMSNELVARAFARS